MQRSMKVDVYPKVFKWLRESSGWPVEDGSKRHKTSIDVLEAIGKGERPIVGKDFYPLVYEFSEHRPEEITIVEGDGNGN